MKAEMTSSGRTLNGEQGERGLHFVTLAIEIQRKKR